MSIPLSRMASDVAMNAIEQEDVKPMEDQASEASEAAVSDGGSVGGPEGSDVVPNEAVEDLDQSVTASNFGETMDTLQLSPVEAAVLRKSFDLLLVSLGWGKFEEWNQWRKLHHALLEATTGKLWVMPSMAPRLELLPPSRTASPLPEPWYP